MYNKFLFVFLTFSLSFCGNNDCKRISVFENEVSFCIANCYVPENNSFSKPYYIISDTFFSDSITKSSIEIKIADSLHAINLEDTSSFQNIEHYLYYSGAKGFIVLNKIIKEFNSRKLGIVEYQFSDYDNNFCYGALIFFRYKEHYYTVEIVSLKQSLDSFNKQLKLFTENIHFSE